MNILTRFKKCYTIKTALIISLYFLTATAQPHAIAILPFTTTLQDSAQNLTNGIYDLLSLRLSSAKDSVLLIDRDSINQAYETTRNFAGESRALMIGAKLQADFVIYGSIDTTDSLITINAQIVAISGKSKSRTLQEEVSGTDAILPVINRFATDCNEQFFAGKTDTHGEQDTTTPDSGQVQPDSAKQESAKDTAAAKPAISKAFKPTDMTAGTGQDFWKSKIVPLLFNGIAIADINNDTKNELVVLTPKHVLIYTINDNTLKKIGTIQKLKFKYPISIDIADINNNGVPEIFVTALDSYQKRVSSVVLEYDGTKCSILTKSLPWYLRVIYKKDATPLLLGQKHVKERPFRGDIVTMKWEKGKCIPDTKLPFSKKVHINAIGLAYGAMTEKDDPIIAAYDRNNAIVIIDSNGKMIGESRESLGGSTFYYIVDEMGVVSEQSYTFLPMRLRIGDIDGDSTNEIIAVKNHDVARNIFSKFKHYNKCHFEVLQWKGMALTTTWKTGIISGFIRDFTIGDIDNDGENELVAALIHREGKLVFSKPKSSIIVYELQK